MVVKMLPVVGGQFAFSLFSDRHRGYGSPMSRFYMTEFYIPRSSIPQVERMLKAGAGYQEIAKATGFKKRTAMDFIAKHKLRAKEPRKLPPRPSS
jgi:hypothetical protein